MSLKSGRHVAGSEERKAFLGWIHAVRQQAAHEAFVAARSSARTAR